MLTPTDTQTSGQILEKIIKVLGINNIAEIGIDDIESFIWSILLSGHYMNLMTIDNEGQIKLRKEYTYPGSHFLSGIYKNFMGNIPDSIYHLSMIWKFMNFPSLNKRIKLSDLNSIKAEFPYKPIHDQRGEYGRKRIYNLIYDRDLTNSELIFKLKQDRDILSDLKTSLDIFNGLREKMSGWPKTFGKYSGNIAFIRFHLRFLTPNGQLITRSGLIFAISGKQDMPGIVINDDGQGRNLQLDESGTYYMDPEHWANRFFPARDANNLEMKDRIFDSDRKVIITFVDQFKELLPYIIDGDIEFYSENKVCDSCSDIIELFRQNYGFTNEDPDLYFGVYGNQRNIPIDIAWLFDLNP